MTPDGIFFSRVTGASLEPAYLLDTKAIVAASTVFGPVGRPVYVDDDFAGLTFDRLSLTLPSDMLALDPGGELAIVVADGAIGTTGFTGEVTVASADLAHPVTGKLLGFPFRCRQFRLDARENALLDLSLEADIHLTALEEGAEEKWVAFDFQLAGGGARQAAHRSLR